MFFVQAHTEIYKQNIKTNQNLPCVTVLSTIKVDRNLKGIQELLKKAADFDLLSVDCSEELCGFPLLTMPLKISSPSLLIVDFIIACFSNNAHS